MATFVFRAVDLAGVPARGEVDAESQQAVTDQLKARGLIVLDIDAKKGSKELTLEAWQGRSPFHAFVDGVARLTSAVQ